MFEERKKMACIGIGIGIAVTCPLVRKKVSRKSNEGVRLVERRVIKSMSNPIKVAPKREKDPKKRIVITGMGVVSVFGNEIDTFYNKLLEGESGINFIDRFDVSTFPVRFAGQIRNFSSEGYIDEKNGKMNLDDCWRYYLVAGKKALEDAKLGSEVLEKMDKTRIGVLVGSGMGGTSSMSKAVEALIEKGHKKITEYFIPFFLPNMGSALLAMERGLMGPNYSISSACASANYCFHAASNHIRRGETDIMVVGGTESIIPATVGGFIACRALSQRNQNPKMASRPWDIHRDGFVMGEGSGVLVRTIFFFKFINLFPYITCTQLPFFTR